MSKATISIRFFDNCEVVSVTTQLKLLAPDGKRRSTDVLDYNGIIALGKELLIT